MTSNPYMVCMTFGLVLEHNFVKNFICNNSNLGKFLIINLVTIIILVTIAVVSVYMVKPVISIIHAAKSQDPPSKLTTKLPCLLIIWTLHVYVKDSFACPYISTSSWYSTQIIRINKMHRSGQINRNVISNALKNWDSVIIQIWDV